MSYDSDTQKVIQVIRQSLADTPLVLVEPAPDVYVDTLADSAVSINVWCWVPFSLWFDMRKQLVEQVMNALTKSGIEIPFPQRVVYLKKSTRRKKPGAQTSAEPPGPGASSSSGVNLEEMVED